MLLFREPQKVSGNQSSVICWGSPWPVKLKLTAERQCFSNDFTTAQGPDSLRREVRYFLQGESLDCNRRLLWDIAAVGEEHIHYMKITVWRRCPIPTSKAQ
jgi:hypothetical protein